MDLLKIREESEKVTRELCKLAKLERGDIFVVGCSSSEVMGENIGTHTNVEVAEAIFEGVYPVLKEKGLHLAAQCCEHLNRALVVEKETCREYSLERVNAIPQPNHAGGAFATVAYQKFDNPYVVESLEQKASAGIDIGGTLIGMHIKPVVVPVRIEQKTIGKAMVICARRRPKYVGGQRAIYDQELM